MEMNVQEFAARVLAAAEAEGITPAEIAYTGSDSFSVRVRCGKLEDYQAASRVSLTLRGRVGAHIGTSSTQALDEESIALLLRGVRESAELIETDEQDDILPPDERYATVCNYAAAIEQITPEQKIALAMAIDRAVQESDPRIQPDMAIVATQSQSFVLMNTLGLHLSHDSNLFYAVASVLAKEGERAAKDTQIRWGYALDAVDPQEIAAACCRDALQKLSAGRLKSGTYPVVIQNRAMADLLSAFEGVFSADNAQQGLSLLAGREGETIASACVTLTDDPLRPWGLGSCPFDREGAAAQTKHLIEGGVLRTLMHNRKTAKKAGTQTTGNAVGGGRVGASNLFFAPGTLSADDLLRNMGDGLYLTEVSGLHASANAVSGDFSLLSRGFWVRDGRPVRAVEQFTVAGNFYKLLEDIVSVGNDLIFEASNIGSPSVTVRALSVAGEE